MPKRPGKISLFSYNPRQPVPDDVELELEDAPAPEPVLGDEDEAVLVERARMEPAAFGQLYERYVDRIYSYIYYRVGNVQDAEDLTARCKSSFASCCRSPPRRWRRWRFSVSRRPGTTFWRRSST